MCHNLECNTVSIYKCTVTGSQDFWTTLFVRALHSTFVYTPCKNRMHVCMCYLDIGVWTLMFRGNVLVSRPKTVQGKLITSPCHFGSPFFWLILCFVCTGHTRTKHNIQESWYKITFLHWTFCFTRYAESVSAQMFSFLYFHLPQEFLHLAWSSFLQCSLTQWLSAGHH